MTFGDIQLQLQLPYDRARWLDILRQILPSTEIFAAPQSVGDKSVRAESIQQLGKIPLAGNRNLAVLEVIVDDRVDLPRNRVGLRQVVARYIDQAEYHGVLAIFHQRNAKDYRFTFAARQAALDDSGQLVRTETIPRRYTYLLGPNESCRTAAERFELLARRGASAELKDVVEAFNVEKLNKEFFADFRKAFDVVVIDILARNQGWERAAAERETQTLLSRLLFLYFIQRKGWLNRQRDYLVSAFNRYDAENADGTSFNDRFLKPFFVKLSTEDSFFPNLDLGDLPFLNGGLFDDEIGSLSERGRMRVGNPAFRHVFDRLLNAYNFTVREDTPLDQEVAIDPEMLGKIFESLVLQLEQSDTGGKTSRHDTGSYYTPRPIVHYLCREGLRAWLEQFPPGKSADWPAHLEKLFTLDAADGIDDAERATLNELLTPDEARALADRLDGFRACDPAVGSGAFLVGLLHELVNLHRLCETRSRGKDPAMDIEWLYETKKRVIENVLYGVDIQQRAVEICKLRLWISLMVDFPLEVDPDNCALPDFRRALKKIAPLPNLDFKIRRANSLIEQIRGHVVKFPQVAADSHDFALSLNKLATAKHRFYEARLKKEKRHAQLDALDATAELAKYEFNAAKIQYGLLPSDRDANRMAEFAAAEAEMGKLQMQIAVARKKNEREKDDEIERLSRVFNNEAKPTFVWQLDFAEIFHRNEAIANRNGTDLLDVPKKAEVPANTNTPQSGFDLVLANPPYLRHEKFRDVKSVLEGAYDCYTGVADLYVYFFERGVKMLGTGGVLSFISSNKFFRAGYGRKLRKYLADNCHIRSIIDFGELPVFTAGTDPAIIIATKSEPLTDDEVLTAMIKDAAEIDQLTHAVAARCSSRLQSTLQVEGWTLENPAVLALLTKLRRVGKPLNDVVAKRFYYGIKTGLNEAFVVDRVVRDRLIAEHPSSAEVLKPFVHGADANKWTVDLRDDWLVYVPWHFPLHLDKSISGPSEKAENLFKKNYPAIYRHLLTHKSALLKRNTDETGIRYEWYALQRWGADYWQEFKEPKIIFNETSKELHAFFDETGLYTNKTLFMLVAPQPKPLLAVLLSRTLDWLYRHEFPSWGDPWNGGRVQFRGDRMATVPIPDFSASDIARLSALVDSVLAAKRAADEVTVQRLEHEIDAHVFRLFALTPEEIEIIQAAQPAVSASINVKSALFRRVLPQLKESSAYFTTDTIVRRVQELGLEISDGTLPVYLTEATASGLIHDAGRGWYSRLSERVPLDPKPVAKLIRDVEKAFPLLDFTVWSTAQINPWMHHLLAQPVAFLHAPSDALESVGDTLRTRGWEVAVNPTPSNGPKAVRPGEKMVVLRPPMSKQPDDAGRQAPIEKILVDLIAEAPRLALMDASEAQGVASAILSKFLVQVAVLQRYADSRAVKLMEVESINQRQANASIGVS